ncbi:MAG: leucine-rich repeat domain-containing protein [Candidatus Hodarchaeota archaeon]
MVSIDEIKKRVLNKDGSINPEFVQEVIENNDLRNALSDFLLSTDSKFKFTSSSSGFSTVFKSLLELHDVDVFFENYTIFSDDVGEFLEMIGDAASDLGDNIAKEHVEEIIHQLSLHVIKSDGDYNYFNKTVIHAIHALHGRENEDIQRAIRYWLPELWFETGEKFNHAIRVIYSFLGSKGLLDFLECYGDLERFYMEADTLNLVEGAVSELAHAKDECYRSKARRIGEILSEYKRDVLELPEAEYSPDAMGNALKELEKTFGDSLDYSHEDDREDWLEYLTIQRMDHHGVRDLKELECLRDIRISRWLELRDFEITEFLNIAHLTDLKELEFKSCNIANIRDLEKLRNLTKLTLLASNITRIGGLDELHNLEELNLTNNKISKIENLHALKNLKILSLSRNQIDEISGLSTLTNLHTLILSSNNITEIKGMEELASLKKLSLSDNEITEIKNLNHLKNLEYLDLSYNLLEKIKGLNDLSNLQHLDLSHNKIAELEGILNLKKLEFIELHANLIPQELLDSFFIPRHYLEYCNRKKYRDGDLTEDSIRELSSSEDPTTRASIGLRKDLPSALIEKLASDEDYTVRAAIVSRSDLSDELIQYFVSDEDEIVRVALAKRQQLPETVIKKLSIDSNLSVRVAIAERVDLPEDVLRILAKDEIERVRNIIERKKLGINGNAK